MVEISIPSLIVIIQAVRRQALAERAELKAMDTANEEVGLLALSLADLEKTYNELREVYNKAREDGYDLPPWV